MRYALDMCTFFRKSGRQQNPKLFAGAPQGGQLAFAETAADLNLRDTVTSACLLLPARFYGPETLAHGGGGSECLLVGATPPMRLEVRCRSVPRKWKCSANPLQVSRAHGTYLGCPRRDSRGRARAAMETVCFPAVASAAFNPIFSDCHPGSLLAPRPSRSQEKSRSRESGRKRRKRNRLCSFAGLQALISASHHPVPRARVAQGIPPLYIGALLDTAPTTRWHNNRRLQ